MRAARPKISEIFDRAARPLPPERLSHDLFLFGCLPARLLDRAHRSEAEKENLSKFVDWPYLSTGIYALPRAVAQIA